MAFKLADFIKETVTSPGSAAFDLNGAVATYGPFSGYLADADTTWYFARLGSQWEAGVGTYVAATDFLNRTAILGSSSGGTTVTFLAGQVVVICGLPAEIMTLMYALLLNAGGASPAATAAQQAQARVGLGVDKATLTKAATYTVVAADYGALIKLSGTFTLALTAAATLGDGFKFELRNTGTGIWTIDPNAAELINGFATFKIYPGESFRVECDGTGFNVVGASSGMVLIESQTAAASAQFSFNNFDSNRFRSYRFILSEVFPLSSGANLNSRISIDGGATYVTSANYNHTRAILQTASAVANGGGAGDSLITILANASNSQPFYGVSGTVDVIPCPSGVTQLVWNVGYVQVGVTYIGCLGSGDCLATANAILFAFNVGTITSGNIQMFGISR